MSESRLERYAEAIRGFGFCEDYDFEAAARAAMAIADDEYAHARETYLITLGEIKKAHAEHIARLRGNPEFAAEQIDGLDASDPEAAHGNADDILLANVEPVIAEAYRRLIDRCRWWATA